MKTTPWCLAAILLLSTVPAQARLSECRTSTWTA